MIKNTKIRLLKTAEYLLAIWGWYLVLFKMFNWGVAIGLLIGYTLIHIRKFVNSSEPKKEYSKTNSAILSIVLCGAVIIVYYTFGDNVNWSS